MKSKRGDIPQSDPIWNNPSQSSLKILALLYFSAGSEYAIEKYWECPLHFSRKTHLHVPIPAVILYLMTVCMIVFPLSEVKSDDAVVSGAPKLVYVHSCKVCSIDIMKLYPKGMIWWSERGATSSHDDEVGMWCSRNRIEDPTTASSRSWSI